MSTSQALTVQPLSAAIDLNGNGSSPVVAELISNEAFISLLQKNIQYPNIILKKRF